MVTDGRTTSFQHLTRSAADHQQVCEWIWTVLLGDGTRALIAAGHWDRARRHVEQHRGIGQRLFDGRQVQVLVRCLGGQPSEALQLLNTSNPTKAWEHCVSTTLATLCHAAAAEYPSGIVETMIKNYLALDAEPGLAVFRARLGLAVLDLSPRSHQAETLRHLTREATTNGDGYVARDVLAHPVCREEMSDDEHRTLSAAVASACLDQGRIPPGLEQDLQDATAICTDAWRRHFARRGGSSLLDN